MSRRSVYAGKVVDLGVERADLPNGVSVDLEVVRHVGAAAVLPIFDDGRVLLVRQWRHATGGWLLEIPAGKLDPGEDPADCARRETEEETGWVAGSLVPLGWIWTTPGFCDERIWLYAAQDLRRGEQRLEHDELLSLVEMPLAEAVEKSISGEITDGKTATLILRAAARVGFLGPVKS
ncbi:MAG: NUDIX hydrolase [Planctomycetota bacterium]